MNIFKGFRRLSLFICIVVSFIYLLLLYNFTPTIKYNFIVDKPFSILKYKNDCPDDSHGVYVFNYKKEYTLYSDICIMKMNFNGELLIPFKNEKETIYGTPPYSSEFYNYSEKLKKEVNKYLNNQETRDFLKNQAKKKYYNNFLDGIINIIIGLFSFYMFIFFIGWIVRGFLNIPIKNDKKNG